MVLQRRIDDVVLVDGYGYANYRRDWDRGAKAEFLAPVIAGGKIAALGVTEPGCGSDVAALRTTVKDGSTTSSMVRKPILPMRRLQTSSPSAVRTGDEGNGAISPFYSQPIRPDFLSVVTR